MRNKLPPISEMEHITSKELGDHFDAILERIDKEDIALIIDHEDKSYVLCPAAWYDLPEVEYLETMVKNAVRYVATVDESELVETIEMVLSLLPYLSEECISTLLEVIKDKTANEHWLAIRQYLKAAQSSIKEGQGIDGES